MQINQCSQLTECVDVQPRHGLDRQALTYDGIKHPARDSDALIAIFTVTVQSDDQAGLSLAPESANDIHLAIKVRMEAVADPAATELMSSLLTR